MMKLFRLATLTLFPLVVSPKSIRGNYPWADVGGSERKLTASCDLNPACANETGACCPDDVGEFNACCSMCENSPTCAGLNLTGRCCPVRIVYRPFWCTVVDCLTLDPSFL
jgi:hypothetical protein